MDSDSPDISCCTGCWSTSLVDCYHSSWMIYSCYWCLCYSCLSYFYLSQIITSSRSRCWDNAFTGFLLCCDFFMARTLVTQKIYKSCLVARYIGTYCHIFMNSFYGCWSPERSDEGKRRSQIYG